MNLNSAKAVLLKNQKYVPPEPKEVAEAFKVFLKSSPGEEEFARHLRGITLTSRMLYLMMPHVVKDG